MLSQWSAIFGFLANIAGVSAFLALFVPRLTDLYISRVSEKYKARLAKDLEEFKEGLRETANKQERLRIHLGQITDFISLSRSSLRSAIDNSQRLSIARKLLDDISKYEQILRETGFYKYIESLDSLSEDDHRLHQNGGDEWIIDLDELLYLFFRDLSLFCANIGHYGKSGSSH
jgi:hypothetical protein